MRARNGLSKSGASIVAATLALSGHAQGGAYDPG